MGCVQSAPRATSPASNTKTLSQIKGSPPKSGKPKNHSGAAGAPKPAALPLPPLKRPEKGEKSNSSPGNFIISQDPNSPHTPSTADKVGRRTDLPPRPGSAGRVQELQDAAKSIQDSQGTRRQVASSAESSNFPELSLPHGDGDTHTPLGRMGQSDVSTDASSLGVETPKAVRSVTEPRGLTRPQGLAGSGGSVSLADASPTHNGVPAGLPNDLDSSATPRQKMPQAFKGLSAGSASGSDVAGSRPPSGPQNRDSQNGKSRVPIPHSPGAGARGGSSIPHSPGGKGAGLPLPGHHAAAPLPQVPANAAPASLTAFSMRDLKEATGNFNKSNLLGEGGFGCVYKGKLKARLLAGGDDDSSMTRKNQATVEVAVKLLNEGSLQGQKEWLAEVQFLGGLRHEHLVCLLGYASEKKKLLLVYEFMPNGSVEELLFGSPQHFPWDLRMKVALGAAKGLAYLHDEERDKTIIYRDFKTSNILLDKDNQAKLSDFGLARMAPVDGRSHVTTKVVGTQGYADPSYVMTGKLTVKSDVYSFGVVLLELMSGRVSLDPDRQPGEKVLVEWALQFLHDRRQLYKMIDPALDNIYSIKAAQKCAQLALSCLSLTVQDRPSTSMLVKKLTLINEICETGQ